MNLEEAVLIKVEGKTATFSITGNSGLGKITSKGKIEYAIDIMCEKDVSPKYRHQYLNTLPELSSFSSQVSLYLTTMFTLIIKI
jgi:hypothetical protein